jgi:hypothetical protein
MGYWTGELELADAITGLERHRKQKEFVTSQHFAAALVGGEGAGKSVALCTSCICNAVIEPNGFSLLGRLNMPALESTTMKTFLELVPANMGEWQEAKKTWTFTNGHQVIFRHLDISDPKVMGHIRSLNLSFAGVDEASEISEEVFLMLTGRLRRKNVNRRLYRSASNPAGHDYQWRHFFDPNRSSELKAMMLGIGASSMDNVFLPEEYHTRRKYLYPADWYDRFVLGSFTDFSDLIFKEFTEPSHVWDSRKPHAVFGGLQDPPADWPVIIGIDIGSDTEHDPWAIVLISVAPDGRLYQFDEIYGNGLLIANIADQLFTKLGERGRPDVAYDYAQRQCAMELAECGIVGQPAIKEVDPGIFKTAQYIHIDPRLKHPFTGQEGSPRYFTANRCVHTIDELTSYKWAKDRSGNATGKPAHEASHSPSAVRYAIHTFRPLPEKDAPAAIWENPNLNPISREYWRQQAQAEKNAERRFGHPLRFQRAHASLFERPNALRSGPKRSVAMPKEN